MKITEAAPAIVDLYDPSLYTTVLETRRANRHGHIVGRWPEQAEIEEGFDSGPVLGFFGRNLVNDAWEGITMTPQGDVIRESTVIKRLTESYLGGKRHPRHKDAEPCARTVLPLATQRTGNYCRWWLDSVSKLFVAHRCGLLSGPPAREMQVRYRTPVSAYQVDTIELLKQRLPVEFVAVEADDPFTAGPAFNSPGMTFGGGQRIGAIVGEYADWLRRHFGVRKIASTGRRIYVSRNESKMRRVVNEDDLLPMLEKLGFEIVRPGLLPLAQQVREFASADVVVSPHGAGLTNILFCRPDAKLVEIFPEGGVHGSAFLRIASQRRMPYAFFVAAKVATPQGEANPNNSDLEIDAHAFERFLATHAT